MPSLASMKSLDPAGDEALPLGPPIRQPQGVAIPARKPTGTPGVFQQADGKLVTDLPKPKAPALEDDEGWKQCLQWYREDTTPSKFFQGYMCNFSGTNTGRMSSSEPHFVEIDKQPKIRGRVHDSLIVDDFDDPVDLAQRILAGIADEYDSKKAFYEAVYSGLGMSPWKES